MTDRKEVQTKLVEFWVPCPMRYDGLECTEPGKTSGRHYPLRRKCRGEIFLGVGYCNVHYPDSVEPSYCECGGKDGYIFNDAPGAIWDAVLAEGGTLRAWIDHVRRSESQSQGMLVAECRLGSPKNEPQIARADSMAEALELAVLRAMEATDVN